MPTIPYTLILFFDSNIPSEVNLGTVVNEATKEHFSVSRNDEWIEVERTRAPKKKGKVYQQYQEVNLSNLALSLIFNSINVQFSDKR